MARPTNAARAAKAEAALEAAKPLSHLEGEKVTVLTSGAGNLSAEDLAAIKGIAPDAAVGTLVSGDPGPILNPSTAPETVPMNADAELAKLFAAAKAPASSTATPEQVSLGARMATMESRMLDIETAMEKLADYVRSNPSARQAPQRDQSNIRRATPAEEAAYCSVNHTLSAKGETPYDGIQAWRDAGSPGLVS